MLTLLCLWLQAPAQAAAPMWRWLTVEQGLDPDTVTALVQGPEGRIWIGSSAGVQGWEGGRVTRLDDGKIRKVVQRLVALPDGRVVARTSAGELWLIDQAGTWELDKPSSEQRVLDIADSGDGTLIVLDKQGLYRWEGERWTKLDDYENLQDSFRLRSGRNGSMLLGGMEGWLLWSPEQIVSLSNGPIYFPFDAVLTAQGDVWLLDEYDLVRKVSAQGHELMRLEGHGDARWMTMRGEELWWTSGDELHRYAPNSPLGLQEMSFSIPGSGPLMMDSEGSLWAGTRRGLGQLAEPDALELSPREQMGAMSGRSVALNGESVWLGTWQNAVHFDRRTGTAREIEDPHVTSRLCLDSQGVAWGFAESPKSPMSLVALSSDPSPQLGWWTYPGISVWDGCAQASDGQVWTHSGGALWRNTLANGPERLVDSPTPDGYVQVLYMHQGSVWVGGMDRVCQSQEILILAGKPAWQCFALAPEGQVADIVQTEHGSVWVSGVRLSVMRLVNDRFEAHPAGEQLPGARVMALRRSPQGGVWVLGDGIVLRVLDQPDALSAWTVVENLSPRLGRVVGAPEGLVEEADGTLWLAGAAGLVSVGQPARLEPSTVPSVRLSEVRVDGTPVPLGLVNMPRNDSRLGLRFTSPSYRAPRLLRFRLRLDGVSIGAPTYNPSFEFAQLGPGMHQIEVAASLDGVRWSPEPALLTVSVPRPWSTRWETWVALLALVSTGLGTVLVLRQRVVLRMERLRSDIAMDLHDEVGAGLASVGLLGGLLQEELPEELHAEVSSRIVVTSKELGVALRSIVWSLQPSSLRIGALGAYLADRAKANFAELDRHSALQVQVPPHQQGPAVDLDILRAVQLIGLEALHNAARHSQATEVRLILEPADRRSWRLSVQDNGVGIGPQVRTSVDSGHGLQSMARRASTVGAQFEVESDPGAGTRVTVTFQPKGGRT